MKRRLMSSVLAIAVLLSLLPVQAFADLGASPVSHVEAVPATCISTGMEEYWEDADGDIYLTDPGDPVTDVSGHVDELPVIPALGHSLLLVEDTATCVQEGTRTFACTSWKTRGQRCTRSTIRISI